MTEEFSLWITKSRLESDIIIDWGDGIVEKLSELTPTSGTANDGQVDVLVYVAHTYEVPNKVYTIKVYGNDYCRLSHNSYKLSANNRLMVRALTDDLPIASHLNNLASFCYGSRRLLKVEMPSYSDLFNQVTNWSGCFNTCQNLIICTGWNFSKSVIAYNALYQYAEALEETDFCIGRLSYSSTTNVFDGCKNLMIDILSLLYSKVNSGIAEVDAGGMFRNCKKLGMGYDTYTNSNGESVSYLITQEYYDSNKDESDRLKAIEQSLENAAVKLADRLWNDKNINWTGVSTCFTGAPDIIRKFVPISWGGTNSSIDALLQITDKMKTDYTAWEVYPNDHIISAGSTEIGEKVWGDDTLTATYAIPASMTEEFSLWITKSRLETDIIIDWGDGVVEKLSELTPTAGADKDGQTDISVYVAHTYEVPNQVYTIKVYGKDYCRISRNSTKLSGDNRLICKCFTKDLPVATHLTNLASFCYSSPRLLKVSVESYSNIFLDVINLSSLFEACKNLITATGFNRLTNDIVKGGVSNFFSGNYALVTTDFVFPENTVACRNTFLNCQRLENTVNSFFPSNGFISKTIDVTRVFGNCKKLQGPVNGDIFWNDSNINWTMDPTAANGTKMTPFTGCSDELLTQVPVSWGGTMVLPESEEQPDNYYSAFEVMPNKATITAGTTDSDTGLAYRFDIAACTTHKMTLRSSQ